MKTRQKKRKNDQTRLLKLKYELLKISTNLLTEFAAETTGCRIVAGRTTEHGKQNNNNKEISPS
jgi:hypothetical protein